MRPMFGDAIVLGVATGGVAGRGAPTPFSGPSKALVCEKGYSRELISRGFSCFVLLTISFMRVLRSFSCRTVEREIKMVTK